LVAYNPLKGPDPEEWLALDEAKRLELIKDYHRRKRVRLPNLKLHAAIHSIVENQIALGDETPAQRAAERLMRQGLDRHEAVHAIGSVLMGYVLDIAETPPADGDPNPRYFAELEALSVESWRREFGEE
jgi:hypothetical protein